VFAYKGWFRKVKRSAVTDGKGKKKKSKQPLFGKSGQAHVRKSTATEVEVGKKGGSSN